MKGISVICGSKCLPGFCNSHGPFDSEKEPAFYVYEHESHC